MAVNLSTRSLLDASLPTSVLASLSRWKVPARMLELEITETIIMTDPVRARRVLTELAEMGLTISIDDFGTGYSSLAYLRDLPVTQLKIDRSFVQEMGRDLDDAVIVRSVVDLARNLGLQTVAEGVEDADTWDQLTALGCDSAQGYFLARPDAGRRVQLVARRARDAARAHRRSGCRTRGRAATARRAGRLVTSTGVVKLDRAQADTDRHGTDAGA